MTISQSQTCSSSLRMCDDTTTVRSPSPSSRMKLAHLVDARRVEAVGGLVEHEQLRVAEQRRGDPQTLLHAERVLRRTCRRRGRRARPGRAPPGSGPGRGRPASRARGGSRCRSDRARKRESRSARRRGRGRTQARPGSRRARFPLPAVGATSPSSIAIVVVLPAPFGPMKPATTPAGTSRLTPSTTSRLP